MSSKWPTDIIASNLRLALRNISVNHDDSRDRARALVIDTLRHMFDDYPKLGLDLDGTIDEYPDMFKNIANLWVGDVVVITYRDNLQKAEERVKELGVEAEVVLAPTLNKAEIIKELGVDVYIDDQDECIQGISDNVLVLKIRNCGNYENGRWLYDYRTGVDVVRGG